MTERQAKRLYWPTWNAVVKARGWRTAKGAVVADLDAPVGAGQVAWLWQRIVAAARIRAVDRPITLDDLRHAFNRVALGRDPSHTDLSSRDLDRVIALMRLIADPDSLDAMMAWQDAHLDARRRVEWAVARLNQAYVAAVAECKFGTRDWRTLDFRQLHQLLVTLRHRPAASLQ